MSDEEPLPISALNHWAYCARRCALIHMDGEFTENRHTAAGRAEHERVDRVAWSTSKTGARLEHALPIWSERLGLIGRCDVVEFWPDGAIYPVEFKHGPKRAWFNDDLQLAAQALCLEEMFARAVPAGAIFHVRSHRRREVELTSTLRARTEAAVRDARALLGNGVLPPPRNDERCNECSMRSTCVPSSIEWRSRLVSEADALFQPDS